MVPSIRWVPAWPLDDVTLVAGLTLPPTSAVQVTSAPTTGSPNRSTTRTTRESPSGLTGRPALPVAAHHRDLGGLALVGQRPQSCRRRATRDAALPARADGCRAALRYAGARDGGWSRPTKAAGVRATKEHMRARRSRRFGTLLPGTQGGQGGRRSGSTASAGAAVGVHGFGGSGARAGRCSNRCARLAGARVLWRLLTLPLRAPPPPTPVDRAAERSRLSAAVSFGGRAGGSSGQTPEENFELPVYLAPQ